MYQFLELHPVQTVLNVKQVISNRYCLNQWSWHVSQMTSVFLVLWKLPLDSHSLHVCHVYSETATALAYFTRNLLISLELGENGQKTAPALICHASSPNEVRDARYRNCQCFPTCAFRVRRLLSVLASHVDQNDRWPKLKRYNCFIAHVSCASKSSSLNKRHAADSASKL